MKFYRFVYTYSMCLCILYTCVSEQKYFEQKAKTLKNQFVRFFPLNYNICTFFLLKCYARNDYFNRQHRHLSTMLTKSVISTQQQTTPVTQSN